MIVEEQKEASEENKRKHRMPTFNPLTMKSFDFAAKFPLLSDDVAIIPLVELACSNLSEINDFHSIMMVFNGFF